jgi:hypothetical protein
MYSTCKNSYTYGSITVLKGTTVLQRTTFSDSWQISGYVKMPALAAGVYKITFSATWTAIDIKDYTIGVYAPEKVSILDAAGLKNEV